MNFRYVGRRKMINIEVAVNKDDTTKQKGDLLEKLAEKLLKVQNYEVEKEIRKVGAELDLLCTNKANPNKEIYVECKAYKESNKIQADVIKNIVGIQTIEEYEEVWLISTSELGKDAKGLVDKLIKDKKRRDIVIYTPEKLIEALINANNTVSYDLIEKSLTDNKIFGNNLAYGEQYLIITSFGYFYISTIKESGNDKGLIFHNAETSDLITDNGLLKKIKTLETSVNSLDFYYINNFIDNTTILGVEENNQVGTEAFKLDTNYLEKINDTGIKLTHPHKSDLTLDDIFVFQDLQDINDDKKLRVSSEKLLNLKEYAKCIVFGEEVSGKTSLLMILQKKFNEMNLIPIYFNAKNLNYSDKDKFESKMLRNLKKQYQGIHKSFEIKDLMRQKNKIVILIDDFENLSIKRIEAKSKFLQMLNENFDNIIIFSDDSLEMEIMTKEELKGKLDNFSFFKIKEYGNTLRDKAIEKWLIIGQEETIDENYLLERKDEVFKMIETVIGNKFIPTYPLYIITLLQQIESGTNNNLGGSAYAEFYNYLINQAMGSTKIKADELDFYHTYLSFLAYSFFKHARTELDKEEIEKLHDKYSKDYHKKSFSIIYENLIDAKLIKEDNDFYSFGHNYIYYFYVAKYLSDNMEDEDNKKEVQEEIDMLIKRLYRTEFANIIIFLIHHSKTRATSIINKILNEAKAVFNDISPSTLSIEELFNINELVTEEINIVIKDNNPTEYRKEELKYKDVIEETNGYKKKNDGAIPMYNEDIKELDIFGKINLSTKLIEILGQISKNYYGSLKQQKTIDIIEELSNLGLRNLNWFLMQFGEYRELLEHSIKDVIEKKNINSDIEVERITKRIIFNFAGLISINFIKRISNSIASKHLFDAVDKLSDKSEAMKLVAVATRLDFSGGLNKDKIIKLDKDFSDNIIVKEFLKHFVIEHLYKFHVPYKKKQEICKKLNISIETQQNMLVHKSKK
jgi:hypothetical protein